MMTQKEINKEIVKTIDEMIAERKGDSMDKELFVMKDEKVIEYFGRKTKNMLVVFKSLEWTLDIIKECDICDERQIIVDKNWIIDEIKRVTKKFNHLTKV